MAAVWHQPVGYWTPQGATGATRGSGRESPQRSSSDSGFVLLASTHVAIFGIGEESSCFHLLIIG